MQKIIQCKIGPWPKSMFDDMNVEEATHIIDMEGAKEINRHEDK